MVAEGPPSAETLSIFNADLMLTTWIANQPTSFEGTWNAQINLNLSDTLNVSTYKAHDDPGACQHGAEIRMALSNISGLPTGQVLQWFQVYTETGNSGNDSHLVDTPPGAPFPILDSSGNVVGTNYSDNLPFYDDGGTNWNGSFFDRPSDKLPDTSPHAGGVSFTTYIVSWAGLSILPANRRPLTCTVLCSGAIITNASRNPPRFRWLPSAGWRCFCAGGSSRLQPRWSSGSPTEGSERGDVSPFGGKLSRAETHYAVVGTSGEERDEPAPQGVMLNR